jgi:hypothetical protein
VSTIAKWIATDQVAEESRVAGSLAEELCTKAAVTWAIG